MINLRGLGIGPRLALALAVVMTLVSVPSAGAYGNTAIWQIGASFNFNSPSTGGGGGGWGWIELDQGGTGDATLADCGHMTGGPTGAPPPAGAQAMRIDITSWDVVGGQFVIEAGKVTYTGKDGKSLGTQDLGGPMPLGIPAKAGHYNTSDILGFTAPGIAVQIQVALIPNR